MQINHSNLAILNQAFSGAFRGALAQAAPMWSQVATLVPSTTSETKYAWLGHALPRMDRRAPDPEPGTARLRHQEQDIRKHRGRGP
jgi:phage major head subunit gpT-like protein